MCFFINFFNHNGGDVGVHYSDKVDEFPISKWYNFTGNDNWFFNCNICSLLNNYVFLYFISVDKEFIKDWID